MNGRRRRPWHVFIGIILASLLAGCATPPGTLFLQPGLSLPPPAASGRPLVQLAPFAEDFDAGKVIGGHFFRNEHQVLKVRKQATALALQRMIARRLAARNIPFVYGGPWNGTIAGLNRIKPPVRLVVDGHISRLWLEVKSGLTHSNYAIQLDVGCRLGVVPERKVISRTVHVSEEVIKFSSRPEEMEKLLDKSLAEAAREIALKIAQTATTEAGGDANSFRKL